MVTKFEETGLLIVLSGRGIFASAEAKEKTDFRWNRTKHRAGLRSTSVRFVVAEVYVCSFVQNILRGTFLSLSIQVNSVQELLPRIETEDIHPSHCSFFAGLEGFREWPWNTLDRRSTHLLDASVNSQLNLTDNPHSTLQISLKALKK
ncbi:hypothetical protein TNCV_4816051 [Trichonephila clavipes]|nr:hypothetical protein TNCV_4816051 [Trichonephila clavipes]